METVIMDNLGKLQDKIDTRFSNESNLERLYFALFLSMSYILPLDPANPT